MTIKGQSVQSILIDDNSDSIIKRNLLALHELNQYNSLFIHHDVYVSVTSNGFYLGKINRRTKHVTKLINSPIIPASTSINFLTLYAKLYWIGDDEPNEPSIHHRFNLAESRIEIYVRASLRLNQFVKKIPLKPINLCDLIGPL